MEAVIPNPCVIGRETHTKIKRGTSKWSLRTIKQMRLSLIKSYYDDKHLRMLADSLSMDKRIKKTDSIRAKLLEHFEIDRRDFG